MDKGYDKIETKTEEEGQFSSQHYLSTNNRQLNEKTKNEKASSQFEIINKERKSLKTILPH